MGSQGTFAPGGGAGNARGVGASTAIIGTTLAWLIVRTDMPGRRWLRLVAALPLVLPTTSREVMAAGPDPEALRDAARTTLAAMRAVLSVG